MNEYMTRLCLTLIAAAACVSAHPMGNFSVSHYTRIEVRPAGSAAVTYVLDLAELPTFELLQKWDLKQDSPKQQLEAKANGEVRAWGRNLIFRVEGMAVTARLIDSRLVMAEGAGNLPIARITSHWEVPLASSAARLEYEDNNYPERAGWKEIVIASAKGATLLEASQTSVERSKGLTEYPADPTVAPPQDLKARLDWKLDAPRVSVTPPSPTLIKPAVVPVSPRAEAPQPGTAPQVVGGPPTSAAPGEVVRGDALSQLLSHRELGFTTVLIALAMAFWFGALHATSPGHGKTMVAAYLIGERGTPKHALFLGGMVTLTHTVSVFALGIATYFFAGSIAPEKVSKFLGILSGLSIVVIGLWLLYTRSMRLVRSLTPATAKAKPPHHHLDHAHTHTPTMQLVAHQSHEHGHGHHDHPHPHSHEHGHGHHDHPHPHQSHEHGHGHHDHPHPHSHDHGHDHPHPHPPSSHDHDHEHGHHHGPGGHSHVPEGPITLGSLIALGASGGLVPCPSALILLLSAISIGRIGFGLALLVAFSLGLAVVLMAIGLAVLYAKDLLPKTERSMKHPLVKLIPVLSAGVVTVIGLGMTSVALGWVKIAGV